jgi:hypothetical protein
MSNITPPSENSRFIEELKNLPSESQDKLIEIYGNKQKALIEFEHKKEELLQKAKYQGIAFGTFLAALVIGLGAFAISQKSNLLEVAALITSIAGLAGVFLWGFQRKD